MKNEDNRDRKTSEGNTVQDSVRDFVLGDDAVNDKVEGEKKKPVCGVDTIQCAHEDEKYEDSYASETYEQPHEDEEEQEKKSHPEINEMGDDYNETSSERPTSLKDVEVTTSESTEKLEFPKNEEEIKEEDKKKA